MVLGGEQRHSPHTQIRAVATLLSTSTSAVVTLASSGIDRPSQLDGKVYASYGARYEGRIVQQMIRNDGGKGEYTESTPPMLGIWNTLLKVHDGELLLELLGTILTSSRDHADIWVVISGRVRLTPRGSLWAGRAWRRSSRA